MMRTIESVGIIGSGMIAVSMAVLFSGNGYRVKLFARSEKSKNRAAHDYDQYYRDLIRSNLLTEAQYERCKTYFQIVDAYEQLKDIDFFIESVNEDIAIKHDVYAMIESICKPEAVIASVTSGIAPDTLAVNLRDKSRLLVAHPYMPPHLVPCIEIVRGQETTDEVVDTTVGLFKSVGREPIILNRAIEGFIANRLQHAMIRESIHLIELGVVSAADIDRTLLTSFGPRYSSIGLFEHVENAGLDLLANIQAYLLPTLCDDKAPQTSLVEKIQSGQTGSKSGKGYLDWSKIDMDDLRRRRSEPYFKFFNWKIPD